MLWSGIVWKLGTMARSNWNIRGVNSLTLALALSTPAISPAMETWLDFSFGLLLNIINFCKFDFHKAFDFQLLYLIAYIFHAFLDLFLLPQRNKKDGEITLLYIRWQISYFDKVKMQVKSHFETQLKPRISYNCISHNFNSYNFNSYDLTYKKSSNLKQENLPKVSNFNGDIDIHIYLILCVLNCNLIWFYFVLIQPNILYFKKNTIFLKSLKTNIFEI